MKYIMIVILQMSNVFAANERFYENHDSETYELFTSEQMKHNGFSKVFGFSQIDEESSLENALRLLANDFPQDILSRYRLSQDEFRGYYEGFVTRLFQEENIDVTLNKHTNILLSLISVLDRPEKRYQFGYEFLYILNLYLKHIGSSGISSLELEGLLFQTYYVSNKYRQLDVKGTSPHLTLEMLMSDIDYISELGQGDALIVTNYHVQHVTFNGNSSQITLEDDHKFGANIYLVMSQNLVIKGQNIYFHPLALIYAPRKNIEIRKAHTPSQLSITNLNIMTNGAKTPRNYITPYERIIRQSVSVTKIELWRKYNVALSGRRYDHLRDTYDYEFSFEVSQIPLAPTYTNPSNGGNISAAPDYLYGVAHLNASGAAGQKGADGDSAVGCIGGDYQALVAISGKLRSDSQIVSDRLSDYESIISDFSAVRADIPGKPGKAGDGQNGGHGGNIDITISKSNLETNSVFNSYAVARFGRGGEPGRVSQCADDYLRQFNSYQGRKGLDGYSGLTSVAVEI